MACALLCFATLAEGREREPRDKQESAKIIREVKEAREFEVRKIQRKIPKEKERKQRKHNSWDMNWNIPAWMGNVFVVSLMGLLIALTVWFVWWNRHALRRWFSDKETQDEPKRAKVVLGMDVTPESLPPDVVAVARALYAEGKTREALALLYRAAISHCIMVARASIRESDTEGDCVQRVGQVGETAHPGFFHELTLAWMAAQYARREMGREMFESLCQSWPYGERRVA